MSEQETPEEQPVEEMSSRQKLFEDLSALTDDEKTTLEMAGFVFTGAHVSDNPRESGDATEAS